MGWVGKTNLTGVLKVERKGNFWILEYNTSCMMAHPTIALYAMAIFVFPWLALDRLTSLGDLVWSCKSAWRLVLGNQKCDATLGATQIRVIRARFPVPQARLELTSDRPPAGIDQDSGSKSQRIVSVNV